MKKKCWSVIASFALVAMASLCLFVTPALAETSYTAIGGSTTFVKNLVVNSDANIPEITFGYTITRVPPAAATETTIEILESGVGASIGNAQFTNADTRYTKAGLPTDYDDKGNLKDEATADSKFAQKRVTVTFPDSSFERPGVYRYVISETDGGKPGVTYVVGNRYLDVFVVADANNVLSVASYVLRTTAAGIGKDGKYVSGSEEKSSGYTNTIVQHDFKFSKAIAGNQGDKNKRFTFTLSISNAIPGVYPISAQNVTENPSSITVASDGTASGTFDLTDGSTLNVLGLNQGAKCTVSEDAQDYTATHITDSGSSVSGNNSGEITIDDSDHTVAFTNTRDGIIPTGVIVTVAPFAIGIVLFTAGIVYVTARRRRNEFA